jgi:hypothetical protein
VLFLSESAWAGILVLNRKHASLKSLSVNHFVLADSFPSLSSFASQARLKKSRLGKAIQFNFVSPMCDYVECRLYVNRCLS